MYCRSLTKMFEKVNIISGPLFLPQQDQETGRNFVKYEVSVRWAWLAWTVCDLSARVVASDWIKEMSEMFKSFSVCLLADL